ncbi:MAG: glycosyltransferase family 4 protein [Pseudomonadota bacterium]
MTRRLIVVCPSPDGMAPELLAAVCDVLLGLSDVFGDVRFAIHRAAVVPGDFEYPVHKILADSDTFRARWAERADTLPLMDPLNPLAERLGFLATALRLGSDDAFWLPDANVDDLEMVYEFLIERRGSQTPLICAHCQRLDHPKRAAQAAVLPIRVRRLGQRLAALDLIGTRLVVSAEQGVLARFLSRQGLPANHAPLLSQAPATADRPQSGRLSVMVASDDASVGALDAIDRALSGAAARGTMVDVCFVRPQLPPEGSDWAARARQIPQLSVRTLGADSSDEDEPDLVIADPDLLPALLCHGEALSFAADLTWRDGAPLADQIRFDTADAAPAASATPSQMLRLVQSARLPAPRAPVVLHIAPAWSGAGSSHVFEAQLRYLEERGFAIFCVHIDTDDAFASDRGAPQRLVKRLPGDHAVARWWMARPPQLVAAELDEDLHRPYEAGLFSLEGEARVSREADIPTSLRDAIAARPPAFVLLNYAHHTPFMRRLGLDGVPVILETHDVRTVQHGIYDERALDPTDEDLEYTLFARSDTTVFINAAEEKELELRVPGHRAASIFPFMDEPADEDTEPTATPVSWLLSAADAPVPLPSDVLEDLLPSSGSPPPVALFVGTNHKANINSLRWYLEEVVTPYLAETTVVTIVVGNISESFKGVDLPNVYFIGRSLALDPWYDRADVILLPIRQGTGLPIKTLDAIRKRRPFVACRGAIQAIPGMVEQFGAFDTPEAFAQQVERLATDPSARDSALMELDRFVEERGKWEHYVSSWDAVLARHQIAPDHGLGEKINSFGRMAPRPSPAFAERGHCALTAGHGLGALSNIVFNEETGVFQQQGEYGRLTVRVDGEGCAILSMRLKATGDAVTLAVTRDGAPAGRLGLSAHGENYVIPFAAGRGHRHHTLEFTVMRSSHDTRPEKGAPRFFIADLSYRMEALS